MELEQIKSIVDSFLQPLGMSASIDNLGGYYVIEPSTTKTGANRPDFFEGMQISCFEDGTFEVSEYQAGGQRNELWIYKSTPYLKVALKDLVKGNKRTPIKVLR